MNKRIPLFAIVAAAPAAFLLLIGGGMHSTPAIAADPPRTGAQVFQTYCASCHAGGWQGAPVANDKSEWEARIANGMDVVLRNTKQGLNAMPPMGTCMDCSDQELTASIKEMLSF